VKPAYKEFNRKFVVREIGKGSKNRALTKYNFKMFLELNYSRKAYS